MYFIEMQFILSEIWKSSNDDGQKVAIDLLATPVVNYLANNNAGDKHKVFWGNYYISVSMMNGLKELLQKKRKSTLLTSEMEKL